MKEVKERRVSVGSVESLDPEEWKIKDHHEKTLIIIKRWRRPRGEWKIVGRRGKVEIRVIRWFLRRTEVSLGWLWAKLAARGKREEHLRKKTSLGESLAKSRAYNPIRDSGETLGEREKSRQESRRKSHQESSRDFWRDFSRTKSVSPESRIELYARPPQDSLWDSFFLRGHSFVSSSLPCRPRDDASAPRNPGEGRTSLKRKRKTRTLPGGTLSRER